jgi:transcriptional adapter 3
MLMRFTIQGDDEECWEMPPLGRHYSEVWEEQDRFALDLPPLNKPSGSRTHNPYTAFTNLVPSSAGGAIQSSANAALRWDPASLTDADCVTEEHGSGPVTERMFSAFMHLPNSAKMEEDDTYRGHGMGRAAGQGTVGDLEERLMKECKALGLILDNDEVSIRINVESLF